MKKFLIIVLSLVLDIIILGSIFTGCYFLQKSITINLSIIALVLTIISIALLITNFVVSKTNEKKFNKMTNEDKLNFMLAKREWVKDNILSLRDNNIKNYKKTLTYGLLVLVVLYFSLIVSMLSLNFVEFNIGVVTSIILSLIIGIINFVSLYSKFTDLFEKHEILRDGGFDVLKQFVNETLKEENLNYEIHVEIYNEANCMISYKDNKTLEIAIGWILLKSLTNDELKAVLFHEIAHYHNLDLEYNQVLLKERKKIYFLCPTFLYRIFCPKLGLLEFNSEIDQMLASSYYENKADDLVVQKNIANHSLNASIKIFGLSLVHHLDYPELDNYIYRNLKWDDEGVALDFKVRKEQYNKHLDFYELASLKHCQERFATHPNIRERREKFNATEINILIEENHYFDEDIKKYYERNNEYWKEKEKSKKYVKVLEEYYALKEKVTDDDIELLNDLAERALKYGEYEDAKYFARRVLELNPKKERAMYILGTVLIAIDHDAEGIPYLNYLIEQDTNEHKINAFHNLATYYVHTGNEAEVERIRNIQIGVLDDSDQYDDLVTIKLEDTLTLCKDQEVINKVIEIASTNNEIVTVMMGVKKIKELECCHVIVFYKEVKDKKAFQDTLHSIFTYLDILEDQYALSSYHFAAIEKYKKLFNQSLTVYKK